MANLDRAAFNEIYGIAANANADMLERLEQIRADIKANLESDALSNPESL